MHYMPKTTLFNSLTTKAITKCYTFVENKQQCDYSHKSQHSIFHMNKSKDTAQVSSPNASRPNDGRKANLWALSPLFVFLCLYLITSILVNDFYKVPITVAFLVSSAYAIAITRGMKIGERIQQYSHGAANPNIMMMIWKIGRAHV